MRKTITFSLNPELADALEYYVQLHGHATRSEFLRRLIRDWQYIQKEKRLTRELRIHLEHEHIFKTGRLD
ncbi:MAG: ribbon-helix-helix domain-containing protein [Candidatus Magasanikbacteria bacterium]|nr:ribbon-helix-helix domain-containing protein [Candidatus Magasanikbacteria bacterium]